MVEACHLPNGRIRAILHPISVEWEVDLNGVGRGTMVLATRDVLIRDIWPHLTSVYISRLTGGGGASQTNPVAEFGGIIDSVQASESGTTNVSIKSIEYYLNHRTIKNTIRYNNRPQTNIGRALVELAQPNGIPLYALADESGIMRDREYRGFNRKVIGEAIEDLTNVINGPDWETTHTRDAGSWSSTMTFRDRVGVDREFVLKSDREMSSYSLEVDAADHATYVDAIGSGEEEDQLIATAVDRETYYPQFDAAPAWKDVSRITTLRDHAAGYLQDYHEPRATPTFTVSGLSGRNIPSPSELRLGDTVGVDTDFGAVTYLGRARIIATSWSLRVGEALTRTYETLPTTRASESVLNQTPGQICEDCQ